MQYIQPYISPVVEALAGLLFAVIMFAIVTLKKKVNYWIKARTTADQRDTLHKIAAEGAALVEAKFSEAGGPFKLRQALQYASDKLAGLGISITAEEIEASVEKAVKDWNAAHPVKIESADVSVTTSANLPRE